MAEIIPEYVHPVFNKTVADLLSEVTDESAVSRVEK
jgi:hypothetical protein